MILLRGAVSRITNKLRSALGRALAADGWACKVARGHGPQFAAVHNFSYDISVRLFKLSFSYKKQSRRFHFHEVNERSFPFDSLDAFEMNTVLHFFPVRNDSTNEVAGQIILVRSPYFWEHFGS